MVADLCYAAVYIFVLLALLVGCSGIFCRAYLATCQDTNIPLSNQGLTLLKLYNQQAAGWPCAALSLQAWWIHWNLM